jgi:hypothetical protein
VNHIDGGRVEGSLSRLPNMCALVDNEQGLTPR